MSRLIPRLCLSVGLLALSACAATTPISTVDHVDLPRFMGKWYVIASIPTFLEKGAHNAVETYRLDEDGSIDTYFSFRDGDFDGEEVRYNPRGFVGDDASNAVWEMQFIWPFRAEYRIVYLDEDYSRTIIGRSKRDYVWVMARNPIIEEAELTSMFTLLSDLGYDVSQIEKVPQQW